MFDKIKALKEKNYYPDTILDIGAHHGLWTDNMLKIYDKSQYFLFEAISYNELNRYKNKKNTDVYNVLLNDKNEEVEWFEMRNTGDSIFKEKTHHFRDCPSIKKQSVTLDKHIADHNILNESKNILIKIDCQGSEIPILKGACSILTKTDFIVLEIPLFGQWNEGVPNFVNHIQFMDSIGFIPFDIVDSHYINGFNMQVDMMFINKNHEFNKTVNEMLL